MLSDAEYKAWIGVLPVKMVIREHLLAVLFLKERFTVDRNVDGNTFKS